MAASPTSPEFTGPVDGPSGWYMTVPSTHPSAIPGSLFRAMWGCDPANPRGPAPNAERSVVRRTGAATRGGREGRRKPLQEPRAADPRATQLELFPSPLAGSAAGQTESEQSPSGLVSCISVSSLADLGAVECRPNCLTEERAGA
jgi:hypothetical protein